MVLIDLERDAGLASLLTSVLSLLVKVGDREVYVQARSVCYSETENMFDWFFDQSPRPGLQVEERFENHDYDTYDCFNEHLAEHTERLKWLRATWRRYVRARPELPARALEIVGDDAVGIHYRGTDKYAEVPRTAFEAVLDAHGLAPSRARTFLATDEQSAADFFSASIPGLRLNSHLRVDGITGLHTSRGSKQQAFETMLDIWCLARCRTLVVGRSNMTDVALLLAEEVPEVIYYQ